MQWAGIHTEVNLERTHEEETQLTERGGVTKLPRTQKRANHDEQPPVLSRGEGEPPQGIGAPKKGRSEMIRMS